MKKLYFLLLAMSSAAAAIAQPVCNGLRYRDFMFQDTVTSNIVYGSNVSLTNANVSLKLDVYEPKGDTATSRPLIILAHGGNFLGGSKTGGDVLQFCHDFAKMGYVVASIDYRVGMTNFPFPGPDSTDATEAVIRAVHDAKAAVRFFKKDYSVSGNTYGIDTSNIYFMGVSAGGFMALHVAYMDEVSEVPAYIDTTGQYGLGGGLEGNSGNTGYSSSVRAVINVAGAIGDTAWIHPGDEPAMLFHGDQDATVPYGSDIIYLLGTYPLVRVHGSESVDARLNQTGIEHCFETHEGENHVPHVGNALYYDTTLVITRNFLVHYVCGDALDCNYSNPVGIPSVPVIASVLGVYPVPARDVLTVNTQRLSGNDYQLALYSSNGQLVRELAEDTDKVTDIDTRTLPSGMYLLSVSNGEQRWTRTIVIE